MTHLSCQNARGQNGSEAPQDCALCPRLADYRATNAKQHPNWFNAPVPSFGKSDAKFLIVGLAPGLKGANRTGRPFTGDAAGDLLYACLAKYGFTKGVYKSAPNDGLALQNCMITNAVRCVPPQNKPTSQEIKTCLPFLENRIQALPRLKIILALGKIAHDSTVRALGGKISDMKFGHGNTYRLGKIVLYDSYHCSRYNTNTRRLTPDMFEKIFADIRAKL